MKPKIVVSQCLGFDHCRYDGSIIPSPTVDRMKTAVEFIPVCPEVAIGLGVPRQPVRIILISGKQQLIQNTSGQDLTLKMHAFVESFLQGLNVQGFILKAKSPSCGVRDVKIYTPQGTVFSRGSGLFAQGVLTRYPHLPAETEKRLENVAIYEHFLQKVFTLYEFSRVKESQNIEKLVDFHTRYKLFFFAHHQREAQILGKIVAHAGKREFQIAIREYETHLHQALKRAMNRKLTVNVLYHALGYFKDKLTSREKQLFLHLLEQFRQGTVPLIALTGILRVWIERFEEKYLAKQAFFAPYPENLQPKIEQDTMASRDYWEKGES
ncbi:MAG: DUF523 and DUF1722 domain-containing protein [Atribacterota bacterium]|nr:DUF523 and DUF1722 domain-containing protein [Atribacterota bacterium]